MRDVDNGYILRYTHANVASFFFIFVYAQFNFTNLFINLFNFFARSALVLGLCKYTMILFCSPYDWASCRKNKAAGT